MDLIVTEKYNAAKRIARILSGGASSTTSKHDVPVFSWGNKRCIGLAGHVVEPDFPDEYNNWNAIEPSALIDADIIKTASKPDIVQAIHSLAKRANKATIATDYDREGELIGKEAHDLIREVNRTVPIDRVRFSSLTGPEVTDAFKNPTDLDFDLAAAGEARQVIDLRWGAALTRYITLAANTKNGDFLSAGRVQTPTLKLVVDREREIENFDPDDYWEIYTDLRERGSTNTFEAQYFYHDDGDNEAERVWREERANSVHSDIHKAAAARVSSVTESTRNDNPPIPFNTTEFIKAANAIGVNAKPAMSIAEDLYTDGYITYPRTDNTVYPEDLNQRDLLWTLAKSNPFEDDAESLLEKDELSPTEGDTETTDHPPIHPTEDPPKKGSLNKKEWRIYELVVRRFFATFADPAKWERLRIDAKTAGHTLKATGKRLSDPGYHVVYPYFDIEESEVPRVESGDFLEIVDARRVEKQTRPPNRYGQSKLIEAMDRLGLGTKSTRHNSVNKLYDRGYITGDTPTPTDRARSVITALEEYATPVSTPGMTAELEENMTTIADGGTALNSVTAESKKMLHNVFDDLNSAETEIRELLQDSVGQSKSDLDDALGDCPECGDILFPREINRSRFIGCDGYPDCEYTLSLPNKGRPHVLDERCGNHGLHKVKMIAGSKTHVFGCPICKEQEANDTDDRVIGACPDCHETHDGKVAVKRVRSGSRLVGCMRFPDCDYSLPLPREGDIEITDQICMDHRLPELIVHQEGSSPWELDCPICNYEEFTRS
jgi:DNA topoisomerase-1